MERLDYLTLDEKANLINVYNNIHKESINKCLLNCRVVETGVDYSNNGDNLIKKEAVPKLTPNLKIQLGLLRTFFSNELFIKNLGDHGTRVNGEELFIYAVLPSRRKAIDFTFIPQYCKGYISNIEYFKRIKSFLEVVHPEFAQKINQYYGRIV